MLLQALLPKVAGWSEGTGSAVAAGSQRSHLRDYFFSVLPKRVSDFFA